MGWLEKGIPKARLMYLEVAKPREMRTARRIKDNGKIDEISASDDVQPPVGGTNKTKLARMEI
jgi:hypothetical protein